MPPAWIPERIERTEAFDRFLAFIAAKPQRQYQKSQEYFAIELGITKDALRTCARRAVELGILEITPSATIMVGIGGRLPNIYRLRITYERWLETREERIATLLADRARERARRKKLRQAAGKERSAATRRARAALAAERDAAVPVGPVDVVEATMIERRELDVLAWLDDVDDF